MKTKKTKEKANSVPIHHVVDPNTGQVISMLNSFLIEQQKISFEEVEALKTSYILRNIIFNMANNETNIRTLKMLANVFDALESEQQKLWHFEVDVNFHRFFDFPGCSCPVLDNIDYLGTPYKVYNNECVIHGGMLSIEENSK